MALLAVLLPLLALQELNGMELLAVLLIQIVLQELIGMELLAYLLFKIVLQEPHGMELLAVLLPLLALQEPHGMVILASLYRDVLQEQNGTEQLVFNNFAQILPFLPLLLLQFANMVKYGHQCKTNVSVLMVNIGMVINA